MTYACEDCGFLFCRVGAAKECPSCEKNNIRSATEEEIGWLQKLLEQGNQLYESRRDRLYEKNT